jgi:NAD-dependent dihydropyrimidine dehydrogenase PreA subunit
MLDDPFPAAVRSNPNFDPAKARRAARDDQRPGEKCQAEPRSFKPRIDRGRCEGKADCLALCPYSVFEVRRIDDGDFRALSLFARLKSRAHGRRTAYTPRADACRACGLCVSACPEVAITLVAWSARVSAE